MGAGEGRGGLIIAQRPLMSLQLSSPKGAVAQPVGRAVCRPAGLAVTGVEDWLILVVPRRFSEAIVARAEDFQRHASRSHPASLRKIIVPSCPLIDQIVRNARPSHYLQS